MSDNEHLLRRRRTVICYGTLFQVEKAASLTGTFQPVGPAQAEKVFIAPGVLKTSAQSFYRVH